MYGKILGILNTISATRAIVQTSLQLRDEPISRKSFFLFLDKNMLWVHIRNILMNTHSIYFHGIIRKIAILFGEKSI